ncbi:hypothetical protein Pelo_13975 [Pelomyxa schiedti]|nr:hypothetical protein Pelo_13975 [Pelomyxa schiedti]
MEIEICDLDFDRVIKQCKLYQVDVVVDTAWRKTQNLSIPAILTAINNCRVVKVPIHGGAPVGIVVFHYSFHFKFTLETDVTYCTKCTTKNTPVKTIQVMEVCSHPNVEGPQERYCFQFKARCASGTHFGDPIPDLELAIDVRSYVAYSPFFRLKSHVKNSKRSDLVQDGFTLVLFQCCTDEFSTKEICLDMKQFLLEKIQGLQFEWRILPVQNDPSQCQVLTWSSLNICGIQKHTLAYSGWIIMEQLSYLRNQMPGSQQNWMESDLLGLGGGWVLLESQEPGGTPLTISPFLSSTQFSPSASPQTLSTPVNSNISSASSTPSSNFYSNHC